MHTRIEHKNAQENFSKKTFKATLISGRKQ